MPQVRPDGGRSRARRLLPIPLHLLDGLPSGGRPAGVSTPAAAAWAAGCAALLLAACAPALDWRQFQPEGWPLAVALPCKPNSQQRQVPLAGRSVAWRMLACSADDHVFAIASADLGDPALVPAALQALGGAARDNLRARVLADQAAAVPGMTPQAAARRWQLRGQLPDGRAVAEQVQVFAHGTRVFQASVIGPAAAGDDTAALDRRAAPFFDALRVEP